MMRSDIVKLMLGIMTACVLFADLQVRAQNQEDVVRLAEVVTDTSKENSKRLTALKTIREGGRENLEQIAARPDLLKDVADTMTEDPSAYMRGKVVNAMGRLDPEGKYLPGALLQALKNDAEREVVPLGRHLLTHVKEIGDLDIALPAGSASGEAGGTADHPIVFRNRGTDAISVSLELENQDAGEMTGEVSASALELDAGEAAVSFLQVDIGTDVVPGDSEKQQLRITTETESGRQYKEEIVFETVVSRILSKVDFGVSASERAHNFADIGSKRWQDDDEALGEPGRRLLARVDIETELNLEKWWHGGWMAFDVEVDPGKQNYFTVKVWGSETTKAGLGLMIGSGDEGDDYRWITSPKRPGWDFYLDSALADAIWEPFWTNRKGAPYPGRWIYRTYPVPAELTEGKSQVRLRLQQINTNKSRHFVPPVVYAAYTHTGAHFNPPDDEEQGEPFVWGKEKKRSNDFTLEDLKAKADKYVQQIIDGSDRFGGILSEHTRVPHVYYSEWSDHYKDEGIVQRAAKEIDAKARTFAEKGSVAGRWAESGRTIARTYTYLHQAFEDLGLLDETVDFGGDIGEVPRREAYAAMFKGEFERFRYKDRSYTNQGFRMGTGCYYLNRALQKLAPEAAIPEEQARWYIYEIFGMLPWGFKNKPKPVEGKRKKWMLGGTPFFQMTDKGFTAEYGYVGAYGEMTSKFARLAEDLGWPSLKERFEQAVKARAHVRMPRNTEDGYRTLRSIGVLSGRKRYYPYSEKYGSTDGLTEAAVLQDPVSVRLADLYLQHHGELKGGSPVRRYEHYKTYKKLPPSDYRLPIEPGHEDYAWGDEQTGLFMIRHNAEFIYGVFYFKTRKPRWGKDDARLRHVTPQTDRVVDLKVEGHEGGGAHPLTDLPPPYPNAAREAWFYQVKYGDLLIGMNTTSKNNYTANLSKLEIPEEHQGRTVKDLVSGREVDLSEAVILPPRTTMVLDLGVE